jgi:hypothetical protein
LPRRRTLRRACGMTLKSALFPLQVGFIRNDAREYAIPFSKGIFFPCGKKLPLYNILRKQNISLKAMFCKKFVSFILTNQ